MKFVNQLPSERLPDSILDRVMMEPDGTFHSEDAPRSPITMLLAPNQSGSYFATIEKAPAFGLDCSQRPGTMAMAADPSTRRYTITSDEHGWAAALQGHLESGLSHFYWDAVYHKRDPEVSSLRIPEELTAMPRQTLLIYVGDDPSDSSRAVIKILADSKAKNLGELMAKWPGTTVGVRAVSTPLPLVPELVRLAEAVLPEDKGGINFSPKVFSMVVDRMAAVLGRPLGEALTAETPPHG